MKIKQAKLAQALPGTSSNILGHDKYDLEFDKGYLTATPLGLNPKELGPFMVFSANIAYLVPLSASAPVEVTEPTSQPTENPLPKPQGRTAKNAK